jgi:hypothetical protein
MQQQGLQLGAAAAAAAAAGGGVGGTEIATDIVTNRC